MGAGDEFVDVGACVIEAVSDKAILAGFERLDAPVWIPKSQMDEETVGELPDRAAVQKANNAFEMKALIVKQWIAEEKGLA